MIILLAGVVALAFLLLDSLAPETTCQVPAETRMPVANPLLEPDRPDLIGEPRIDE